MEKFKIDIQASYTGIIAFTLLLLINICLSKPLANIGSNLGDNLQPGKNPREQQLFNSDFQLHSVENIIEEKQFQLNVVPSQIKLPSLHQLPSVPIPTNLKNNSPAETNPPDSSHNVKHAIAENKKLLFAVTTDSHGADTQAKLVNDSEDEINTEVRLANERNNLSPLVNAEVSEDAYNDSENELNTLDAAEFQQAEFTISKDKAVILELKLPFTSVEQPNDDKTLLANDISNVLNDNHHDGQLETPLNQNNSPEEEQGIESIAKDQSRNDDLLHEFHNLSNMEETITDHKDEANRNLTKVDKVQSNKDTSVLVNDANFASQDQLNKSDDFNNTKETSLNNEEDINRNLTESDVDQNEDENTSMNNAYVESQEEIKKVGISIGQKFNERPENNVVDEAKKMIKTESEHKLEENKINMNDDETFESLDYNLLSEEESDQNQLRDEGAKEKQTETEPTGKPETYKEQSYKHQTFNDKDENESFVSTGYPKKTTEKNANVIDTNKLQIEKQELNENQAQELDTNKEQSKTAGPNTESTIVENADLQQTNEADTDEKQTEEENQGELLQELNGKDESNLFESGDYRNIIDKPRLKGVQNNLPNHITEDQPTFNIPEDGQLEGADLLEKEIENYIKDSPQAEISEEQAEEKESEEQAEEALIKELPELHFEDSIGDQDNDKEGAESIQSNSANKLPSGNVRIDAEGEKVIIDENNKYNLLTTKDVNEVELVESDDQSDDDNDSLNLDNIQSDIRKEDKQNDELKNRIDDADNEFLSNEDTRNDEESYEEGEFLNDEQLSDKHLSIEENENQERDWLSEEGKFFF